MAEQHYMPHKQERYGVEDIVGEYQAGFWLKRPTNYSQSDRS